WSPAYEARADEVSGAVELSTFATVRQSTGEPWSAARVVLSTAVPRQDATPPQIAPLRLWAEERRAEKKVLAARTELHERAEASGEPAPAATPGPSQPTTGGLRAAAQGLSVQLAVPEPADVAGDGTPSRLFVARTRLRARFV